MEPSSLKLMLVMRTHPTLSEAMTEAAEAVGGKPIHI